MEADARGTIITDAAGYDPLRGAQFFDVFELVRKKSWPEGANLLEADGAKMHFKLRDAPETRFKGIVVATPGQEAAIVNLSFGIGVVEAVGRYGLTAADFPANDLTIEMLYLVEANSAAMEESRKLNQRLQGAMIAAQEKAYTDGLTGLKIRRALDYVLEQALEKRTPFSLMQLDLDFFKAVNDTLGHAAGDKVLREVAEILRDETRDMDTVARVGGDEFVLILDGHLPEERIGTVAARMIQRIEEPVPFGEDLCKISASIGITQSAMYQEAPDAELMMEDADMALYASKRNGRAQFTLYAPHLRDADGPLAGEPRRAAS